jgi:hypothetical protein
MDATYKNPFRSQNWTDDDGESNEELPLRSEEVCPEGSVPLHQLCDRCRRMLDGWTEMYAWFDESGSRGTCRFESWIPDSCTLKELVRYRKTCHLCELLCSGFKDYVDMPLHNRIVCRVDGACDDRDRLYMDVELEGNPRSAQTIYLKSFTCESYPISFKR